MAGTTIIVGATGGMGSALARRLAARGVALHLVARDTVRLKPLAGETSATFDVADVLDSEALTKAVQAAEGPVEALVYAVGSIKLKPLARLSPDDFVADLALNALGAAIAIQAALPAMKGMHRRVQSSCFQAWPSGSQRKVATWLTTLAERYHHESGLIGTYLFDLNVELQPLLLGHLFGDRVSRRDARDPVQFTIRLDRHKQIIRHFNQTDFFRKGAEMDRELRRKNGIPPKDWWARWRR